MTEELVSEKNNIIMDKILNLFVKLYMYAIHSRIIAARKNNHYFSCVQNYVVYRYSTEKSVAKSCPDKSEQLK